MKAYWVFSLFLSLLLLFVFCRLGAAEDISTIDVLKANDLIRSGNYGYLDVRTEEEFKKGHVDVQNPLNVAYMFNTPEGRVKNPNFLEQVLSLCNKADHLVVGCQSGVRSVYATVDLQSIGFEHLYNMGGGYLAWIDNGLPVTKPETKIDLTVNVIKPEAKIDLTEPKAENGLPLTSNEVNVENGVEDKAENTLHVIVIESKVLPGTVTEPKLEDPKIEL